MPRYRLYNPAQLTPDELKASFIARQDLLNDLVRHIREQRSDRPCQHLMIIGQRGMGKTTLGLRLTQELSEDHKLREMWQPVPFFEESYGIGDMADFWLTTLRHLAHVTRDEQWSARADTLLERETDPERLRVHALDSLLDYCRETGKRLFLFIENLDQVFDQFNDQAQIYALRAGLMEHTEILLLGTANTYFEEMRDRGEPFYEFFRVISLQGLDDKETHQVLTWLADQEGNETVLQILKQDPGRIEAVRRLTGGNPRLVLMAYRFISESPVGTALEDLEKLIDEQTPYFKARIDRLPRQLRQVFHSLADGWAPMHARDVAKNLRMSSSHASAQLRQLVNEGYVETVATNTSKKIQYQIQERFYNIYYVLRFSRNARERLERLVDFLQQLFGPIGLRGMYLPTLDTLKLNSIASENAEASLCILARYVAADEAFEGRETWWREALQVCALQGYSVAELLQHVPSGIGQSNEIESMLRHELQNRPDWINGWSRLGIILADSERFLEAKTAFQKVAELAPDEPETWVNLGLLSYKTYHPDDAERHYNRAIEISPDEPTAWHHYGIVLEDQARLVEAEQAYRKLVKLRPADSHCWYHLGVLLLKVGTDSDAIEALEKAIEIEPGNAQCWSSIGITYQNMGRNEKARDAFERARCLAGDDAQIWGDIGRVLAESGNTERAEEALQKATDISPEDDKAWRGLGRFLAQTRRYADAEKSLKKASELAPGNPQTWMLLGLVLRNLSRLDDSEAAYRKCLELDDCDRNAWHELGVVLERAQRLNEAEEAFEKMIELNCDDAHAWIHIGSLKKTKGQLGAAKEALEKAVKLAPDNDRGWLSLGAVLADLDEIRDAGHAFEKAVDADPDDPVNRNALAWHLLVQGKHSDLPKAERHSRRAVLEAPNSSSCLHTLSDVLARQGKWAEALDFLSRSVKTGPQLWRELVATDLTQSLIRAVAAGHAERTKTIIAEGELNEVMEPLALAVALELEEQLDPQPVEIMDAVREVQRRISEAREAA